MRVWPLVAWALAWVSSLGLCAAASQRSAEDLAVTPIQKVLTLLNDMLTKGTAAKKEEAHKFSAFAQWCTDQEKAKTDEISAADEQIELLNGEIMKAAASIRSFSNRIQELDDDIGRWEKDKTSASDVREKEATDYEATLTDYSESLDALTGAIAVLKKQAYDRPQAGLVQEALLQVQRRHLVPAAAKSAVASFLQQTQPDVEEMPSEYMSYQAPEAYSYEFQSGGVVDILEKLKTDFTTKKNELMSDELKAKHSYQSIAQQLTDNIENAQNEVSKKTTARAEAQETKAGAEATLATTTKDRNEDQRYLDETKALCKQKSMDFQSRQDLRAEEITGLEKAIEIISSDTVKGSGDKYLPSLLQTRDRRRPRPTSLAQLRVGQGNPLQERVASFLAERAQRSGSHLLYEASQRVAADPFGKVKKLIRDLMSQLMQESTSETEHKGWCDTELTTNKQTRDKKTEQVSSLTAEGEDLTAQITQLTQDLSDLATGIQEIESAMAQATADRQASKATNEQTVKDAKAAQVAVQQAIAVLKDYYAKSVQATSLFQQDQSPDVDAPETFDKPYKGMFPEGGNIVDFLEVILTDFTRLESETSSDETAEADEYDKFMFESKKDKALKENESKHKDSSKTDKESALHSVQEELKTTQEQLSAAMKYFEKLKPTCVDSGITYEERVKRREEEIQSLKEALAIITGQDIA